MMIFPKWMRKLNEFLILPWLIAFPIGIVICIWISAYFQYIALEEDIALLWFNFACLYGTIWIIPIIINLLTAFVEWVCEKIHFIKLDRYYKKYPEKEKENAEKLAKDFEEIAKIIRGEDKK